MIPDPRALARFSSMFSLTEDQLAVLFAAASGKTAKTVDYAQIKRGLDALEARALEQIRASLVESRDAIAGKIRRSSNLAALAKDITLPYAGDLRRAVAEFFRRAWDAGLADARAEVRIGKRTPAAYRVESSFAPREALRWLNAQSFTVSGILGDSVLNAAKQVILNGMKAGRRPEEIVNALAAAFEPYVGNPNVIQDAEQLAPYRLETIVRTNTTAAYNHGRLTTFVSEDVIDSLLGVRYSAILDERTTEVCRFLDGRVFAPGSAAIEELLPPNHFNCRSIVAPVVIGETVDAEDFITPEEIGKAKTLADAKFLTERGVFARYRSIESEEEA